MYGRYIPPPKGQGGQKAEAQPGPVAAPAVSTNSSAPYARYIPPQKTSISGSPTLATVAPTAAGKKIVFSQYDEPTRTVPQKLNSTDEAVQDTPKKRKRGQDDNVDGVAAGKKEKKSKTSKGDSANGLGVGTSHKKGQEKVKPQSKQDDYEAEPTIKKEKKDKKKRRSVAEDGEELSLLPEAKTPEPGDEGQLGLEAQPDAPRPKKEKRKNKKSEAAYEQADIEDEKTLKRHKSILERKEKALKQKKKSIEAKEDKKGNEDAVIPEPEELHGLEPLPQPEPVVQDGAKLTYDTLPPWLAHPTRVQPNTKKAFVDLGIEPEAAHILASRGYQEAFAVQTAAIPLLLPSLDRQGDVVVSAATGSGKTLAYVLPMVRDISQGIVTKLRGLIVVPTRELVRQAQEACEVCAGAFAHGGRKRVKVGISMGSMAFQLEQAALMEEVQVYDPEGYLENQKKRSQFVDFADFDEEDSKAVFDMKTKALPDHVVEYVSKVDILICTPGRLVEHITKTPGFTLDYVRWLVVDEADKLLAQSFQQWLDVVMEKLSTTRPSARDFPRSNKSGVRKVILSATMTRDLSLLNGLKLRWPTLVVLEGSAAEQADSAGAEGEHVLPDLLHESVIKVRDTNLKPLYLIDLLESKHMVPMNLDSDTLDSAEKPSDDEESDSSPSGSDSESDSDLDSDSATSTHKLARSPALTNTTVLIFTKSNESALRLSRLLALLSPSLSPLIGTLTSTTPTAMRRRTLASFSRRKLRVLVASDLVARGIDLAKLDHVVNYDVPGSAAAYVHRVGRTARAGRRGAAWTLVSNAEAAWFFREIGGEVAGRGREGSGGGKVRRAGKIERVRVGDLGEDGFGEERVSRYESALEQLGKEAGEGRRRR